MIARSILETDGVIGGVEVDATVRELVAEHLGVDSEQLAREVSLVDDLAADSLDLVEIAVAIEGHLGIELPQRFLDQVRTFGDLIEGTVTLAKRGRRAGREDLPVPLRARITPAGPSPAWTVERVLLLTPYAAETLSRDAVRAGSGGRPELVLAADASPSTVASVESRFGRLVERGVDVDVRRDNRGPRRATAA
jgi:acyl carrier protein